VTKVPSRIGPAPRAAYAGADRPRFSAAAYATTELCPIRGDFGALERAGETRQQQRAVAQAGDVRFGRRQDLAQDLPRVAARFLPAMVLVTCASAVVTGQPAMKCGSPMAALRKSMALTPTPPLRSAARKATKSAAWAGRQGKACWSRRRTKHPYRRGRQVSPSVHWLGRCRWWRHSPGWRPRRALFEVRLPPLAVWGFTHCTRWTRCIRSQHDSWIVPVRRPRDDRQTKGLPMNLVRDMALRIPPVRRLHAARNALLTERDALLGRLTDSRSQVNAARSPFYHFNACFDAQEVIRRHAAPNVSADPQHLTNYLGVRINPKFFPTILTEHTGLIEPVPIPANWHADIAEWGAALRAVDLAGKHFTMIELGCGWGCWMNNTGVAARRAGKTVHLIGVEGDRGHIAFARESTASNGFKHSEVVLHHGIAAASAGTALFPRQTQAGVDWGLKPIFGASDAQRQQAQRTGSHDVLRMITLAELAAPWPRIDLLHIDIQGGEADLIAASLAALQEKVAYLLIGTHSRPIEGKLFDTLLNAGWRLEIERPALLSLGPAGPIVTVDGVQGWRNSILLME
jgi:hypothetical protein